MAARSTLVSTLDPKLPNIPLERWLMSQAGPGVQISWEGNDCGEQTGAEADRGRDFPICGEATAKLTDGRVIVVSVAVGSYKSGIGSKAELWTVVVGDGPFTAKPLKRLSEVPRELSSTKPSGAATHSAGSEKTP